MSITTRIYWEVTDTFGGEANYSWVKRGKIDLGPDDKVSDLAIVRRVKKAIGWTGVRCRIYTDSGIIEIHPREMNQVCFITLHCFGSCG